MKFCKKCGKSYKGREYLCSSCMMGEYQSNLKNKNMVDEEKMEEAVEEVPSMGDEPETPEEVTGTE